MHTVTYSFTVDNQTYTIHGFLAWLLNQGEQWDYRCVEADMHDYHQQQYARMDGKEALVQEIQWWLDAYQTEPIHAHPNKGELLSVGVCYLYDCVQKLLTPDAESDKLTSDMHIYIDEQNYLYKVNDYLALFNQGAPDFTTMLFGFPAQLLTYAACTTIDTMIEQQEIDEPLEWVYMMKNWLHTPPFIRLSNIRFDIPNVYTLYDSYLAEEKRKWEMNCQKRYQSQQPQFRSFMAELMEQVHAEADNAIKILTPYLSEKQRKAYVRYLDECQLYLSDHSQSRSKGRSYSLDKYWCDGVEDYIKQAAIRKLKTAVKQEHPAAALADTVMRLQQEGALIRNIRPLTHFVEAVNKVCKSDVKHDSFSKHFR